MKVLKVILFIIGLLAVIISLLSFFFFVDDGLYSEIEETKIYFSENFKWFILIFFIGIFIQILSLLIHFFELRNIIRNKFLQLSTDLTGKFNYISKKFKLYPTLNFLMNHFNYLEEVANQYETVLLSCYDHAKLLPILNSFTSFWFDSFIDCDLDTCCNQVRDLRFELKLDERGQAFLREFIKIFWENVDKNKGVIYASSIVDPNGFWKDADEYLEIQKNLIEAFGIRIYRYFIIAEEHLHRLSDNKEAIEKNIANSILTRVTIFESKTCDLASKFYFDRGLVDQIMAIDNKVIDGNISKSTCYVNSIRKNNHIIDETKHMFGYLEKFKFTLKYEQYDDKDSFFEEIKSTIGRLGQ